MLGPVEVRRDGEPVAVPGGKTAELLVHLALAAGTPVRADRLLDDLWAGTPTNRNTLQQKVARLRRSRATFCWSVLRLVGVPAQRSSRSRSTRTGVPPASARCTKSSAVLPLGIATGFPSRLTSTGPSTRNSSTTRV